MSTPKSFKLKQFHTWAREAPYEDVFVYHREPYARELDVFTYARKLHEAGMVFLFDRRIDKDRFEKCARRTPVVAHFALDKVSAAIKVDPSTAYVEEKAA